MGKRSSFLGGASCYAWPVSGPDSRSHLVHDGALELTSIVFLDIPSMGLAYYNGSWLFVSISHDTFTQMILPVSVSLADSVGSSSCNERRLSPSLGTGSS